MPRLFTALQLPADIAAEIAQFRGGLPGARWIEPSDYHITLRFIGDIGLQLAREINSELSHIDHAGISIQINGLDSFGGKSPRAIFAGVKPSAALSTLQEANERAVRRAGVSPETRKFQPHVTIARLRNIAPAAVADYFYARSTVQSWRFEAEEFALLSARESTGGGPYRVEAVYPLRALPALRPAISQ